MVGIMIVEIIKEIQYYISGETTLFRIIFLPSEKDSTVKRKNLHSKGINSCLLG